MAFLSLHTSPLIQPGSGDGGGMNVYVRELVSALAQNGTTCRVYVRRWRRDLPNKAQIEPGFEVVHIPAGPPETEKEHLENYIDDFAEAVAEDFLTFQPDVIHANYWLSGIAGKILKQRFSLPLLTTFHTLARVKAEAGDFEPESRAKAEAEVMGCADLVLANATAEANQLINYYDCDPARIEILPPGVDHALFSVGSQAGARWALGTGNSPHLLFVGRIQPLKGVEIAVRALALLQRNDARMIMVGGASGPQGNEEVNHLKQLIKELDLTDRILAVPSQPHHLLSSYYRASDVCLVPSRSESFGLVALEAAACGVPVVASAVGGLLTLIEHGHTGYLVDSRDPQQYADWVDIILSDPVLARRLSVSAAGKARTYTWTTSATRLRRLYQNLTSNALSPC